MESSSEQTLTLLQSFTMKFLAIKRLRSAYNFSDNYHFFADVYRSCIPKDQPLQVTTNYSYKEPFLMWNINFNNEI